MEKRYIDFMDEITDNELYDKFILHGLFSEKLPPIFDNSDFLRFCKKTNRPEFNKQWHGYILYENMRNINLPRLIGVPNPMSFERLCKCLMKNWGSIKEHFRTYTSNQDYIVSRVHIRKMQNTDALFKMTYSNWKIDGTPELDFIAGKHYKVSVDISKCFPSIYTHSIVWALLGKDEAKRDIHTKNWANDIDEFATTTNNGETHGILIGPHTSNLLSEIILCRIDYELCKEWKFIRSIDDYVCYVENKDDIDRFLMAINRELKKFGLFLNHKKTEVEEMPAPLAGNWVNKMQDKVIYWGKFKSYVDYMEIKSFFNFCINLMSENENNSSILFYGMKMLSNYNLTYNAKRYAEKTFIALSTTYPYIVPLLQLHVFKPFGTKIDVIKQNVAIIYEHYLKKDIFEACSYALYYAIINSFQIDTFDIETIIGKDDCILSLMALIYCRKNDLKGDLEKLKNHAIKLKDGNRFDEQWVFIYETLPEGMLKDDWKALKREKVSFLKVEFRKWHT